MAKRKGGPIKGKPRSKAKAGSPKKPAVSPAKAPEDIFCDEELVDLTTASVEDNDDAGADDGDQLTALAKRESRMKEKNARYYRTKLKEFTNKNIEVGCRQDHEDACG